MLLVVILVAMNALSAVGFVGMAVPAADLVILLFKKPYKRMYNNYRAIIN